MGEEHWLRLLLGAGASLLVAIASAVIRLILNRRVRPPGSGPTSETTDTLTLKIEHHREVRPTPEQNPEESPPNERPGARPASDADGNDRVA